MPLPDHLKIMMSSEKTDYATPWELFRPIDKLFHFTLDVCATAKNTKCKRFISPEEDAFVVPWYKPGSSFPSISLPTRERCWMNPPYGNPEHPCKEPHVRCKKKKCQKRGFHISTYVPGIGDWMQRALDQSIESSAMVVSLIPVRTDTDWFQPMWKARLICFLRGRYVFGGADSGATFPNVVTVFSPDELDDDKYEGMTRLGNVIDPRKGGILLYTGGKDELSKLG